MTTAVVATVALVGLLTAGGLVGRVLLSASQRAFDAMLGEQHEDLSGGRS